jgi:hypothetical protein
MSRRPPSIKPTDVTRVLKGTEKAGLEVQRFEVDPVRKTIVVYVFRKGDGLAKSTNNEWDNLE